MSFRIIIREGGEITLETMIFKVSEKMGKEKKENTKNETTYVSFTSLYTDVASISPITSMLYDLSF